MIVRWFFSPTVRQACAVRKHVYRLLCAQRDILPPQAIGGVTLPLNQLQAAITGGEDIGKLRTKMDELDFAANKWLKPYPNAMWRENIEVILVAVAVAMAIRTFFVQPFKIPTGSMQPTLFGVTSKNYLPHDGQPGNPHFQFPTGWERIKQWFEGISYLHVVAQNDGAIESISPMMHFLIFNIRQSFSIGGVEHVMWFPPDYGEQSLAARAGLDPGHVYHRGDDVIKIQSCAGDHLFVDRLTYNFCKPGRGEIVVFETKGIQNPMMPQDQFYIKRLVALPGDHVQIGDDRHLIINGERLDASTPHFAMVYSFNPKQLPRESEYSGHVNGTVAAQDGLYPNLAPLFPDQQTVYTNSDDAYMVMGDNTCNSFDSRAWGNFPAHNVIGKSFFVYWPITKRFGWGNQ